MAQTINEIMTHDPRTVGAQDTLADAAREMRDGDIGAVLVTDGQDVKGILTDRDIVVRCVAEGRNPAEATAGETATGPVQTLTPDQSIEDAVRFMKEHDVRRAPVVQDGRPVGIISLGDLAIEREPGSALGDISSAAPNN